MQSSFSERVKRTERRCCPSLGRTPLRLSPHPACGHGGGREMQTKAAPHGTSALSSVAGGAETEGFPVPNSRAFHRWITGKKNLHPLEWECYWKFLLWLSTKSIFKSFRITDLSQRRFNILTECVSKLTRPDAAGWVDGELPARHWRRRRGRQVLDGVAEAAALCKELPLRKQSSGSGIETRTIIMRD